MIQLFDTLLEASIRSLMLAAVVYLLLSVLRVRDAAWRHAAWTAVLCAMLVMPVLPHAFPTVPVVLPIAPIPVMNFAEPPRVPAVEPLIAVPVAAALAPVFDWARVWTGLYFCGSLVLVIRLIAGWWLARRLLGRSAFVPAFGAYESAGIAGPITIGVFAPKVVLPAGWRNWPAETLRAVLAHERAHVARRDTAITVLARINTCVFWFHPLAWGLERALAATAEFACDAAALRELGARERYAEALIAMARRQVLGVSFAGVGLLEKRVDWVLNFGASEPGSRWRKVALGIGCTVAIVASCSRAITPLRDNPARVEIDRKAEAHAAILKMTPLQVSELEATTAKNPNDLDARGKLLEFYATSGDKVLGREKTVTARRPHILWVIANHPEHELAGSWGARIFPTSNDRDADPVGYAQARALWLQALNRPSVSTAVLANAVAFFQVADKVLAEELLLRLQTLEPGGRWSGRLGHLYYQVLMGSDASMPQGVIRSISRAKAHGPHANAVRAKLATSNDVELLTATGQMLINWGSQLSAKQQVDFDALSLGRSYLDRALQLDPQSTRAKAVLRMLKQRDEHRLNYGPPGPEAYEAVAALPDVERLPELVKLAQASYIRGDMDDYYRHDVTAAKTSWTLAKRCVEDALRLAPTRRGDRSYGAAVYAANMIGGMLAMREGERARAVRHLLAAVDVPPSEDIAYAYEYWTFRLPGWLLKDGEREPVITFLKRLAAMHVPQRAYLLESAELIRKGVKPLWYPSSKSGG